MRANKKIKYFMFGLIFLTFFMTNVNATDLLTGCISYQTGDYIDCTANYDNQNYNYIVGTPTQISLADNILHNILYSANGHFSEYYSIYLDSRLNTCLVPGGCDYTNGDWRTVCQKNSDTWWSCDMYFEGSFVDYFFLRNDGKAVLITYLTPGTDSAPIIGSVANQTIAEDSSASSNIVDLYDIISDDRDSDSDLTISIESQSNSSLINCAINSTRYISCAAPAANQSGTNVITIRAIDSVGQTRTNSFNVVVTPVNDAPTAPTSLTFNAGVYGNGNNTVTLTCAGSTDIDSTVYYNIESNITGSWVQIAVNDSDGIFDFDISSYDTRTGIGFRCQATDLINTSDYFTSLNTIDIDDSVPLVFDLVANNIEFGNNNEILVNVTDTTSVASVILEVNSSINYTMTLQSGNTYNYTFANPNIGTYNLRIYAIDNYNNINDSITGSFNVSDTIAPSVFGLIAPTPIEFDNNLTIQVNVTDLNLDTVLLEINGSNQTLNNPSGDIYNISLSLDVGSYPFTIYANDSKNNLNGSVTGTIIVQDTTTPLWNPLPSNQVIELGNNFDTQVNATDLQTITYSLNDTTNFAINSSGSITNVTSLTTGIYQLELNATDASGNVNSTNINITVQDTTSPLWNPLPSNQVIELGNSFGAQVNATDLNFITYSLNDTTNFAINSSGSITNATSLTTGIYQLELNATDASGNVNSTNINVTVQDTTSPSITDLIAGDVEFDGNVTFTANVTDLSTIDNVWVALSNGSNYSLANIVGNTYEYELNSPSIGNYNFTIYANDTYSNLANISGNFTAADTTTPSVFGLNTNSPVEFNGDINITVNVTDLTLDQVWVEINGGNETMSVLSGDIYNLTLSGLSVGSYPYTIYVNDTYNNLNDSVTGTVIIQDTTAPAVFDLTFTNSIEFDNNLTIFVNVTDLSTITSVLLEYNGINYSMNDEGNNRYNYTLTSPNVGDNQVFTIYANDSQNNLNGSITGTFNVTDLTAPLWNPLPSNQTVELGEAFSYDVNATDLQTITYSLNNSNFNIDSNGLITNTTSLNLGIYQLELNATDTQNNTNSTNINVSVVDTTAPKWSPLPSNQSVELGEVFNYGVNVTDLQSITYSLNDTANFAINSSGSITNATSLSVGIYQLELNATDASGNVNTTNINVSVVDSTSPVWNPLPSNQVEEFGNNFEYDVNATDLQSITYNLNDTTNFAINSSGSITNATSLSVGTYQLQLNATDSANNVNSTNINITIQDTTIPQVFGLQTSDVEFDGDLTVRVNATDLSGIAQVILELDSTTNYTMVLETGDMYNYTLTSPSVGTRNIRIYVSDTQGNRNDSITGSFNVNDTTNPLVTNIQTNTPVEFNGEAYINVTVTDLNLDTVWIEINGNNETMTVLSGDIYNLTVSNLGVGSYPFTVYANDTLGNLNDSETGTIVVQDTIVPQVTNLIANNVEFNQNNTINVTVTDLSGVAQVILELDGTTNYTMTNNSADNFNVTLISPSVGVHNIVIYANDTQGNRNDSVTGSFTVTETTAPSVTNIITNSPVEFNGNVTFNATITDLSTIDSSLVELNGTNYSMSNTSLTDFNLTISGLSVGSYPYTIYVNDTYNNLNDSVTGTVIVQDTIAPVWSPVPSNQTIELGTSLVYDTNATDLRTVSYSVNDTANFKINSSGALENNTALSVGVYMLELNASDGTNHNLTNINVSVVDTIVPAVFGLITNATVEFDDNVEFYINVTDLSTISSVLLEYSGVNYSMTNLVADQYNYTLVSPAVGNGQAYTIYAIDSEGNVNGSISGTFDVTDLTVPEVFGLNTNSPVEFNGDANITVNVTDLNLDNVWVEINGNNETMTVLSGDIYNLTLPGLAIGSYPFTIYANDSYTNLNDSVTGTIIVQDSTAPSIFDLVAGDVEFDGNVTFNVNVTDLSTIDDVWLALSNGTNYSLANIGGNTYEYELDSPSVGNYNFTIYANDTYSNLANVTGNFTAADTTIPEVFALVAPTPVELGINTTVEVNITDLTLDQTWIEINSTNTSLTNPTGDLYVYNESLAVGSYPFTIYANDSQNNINNSITGTIIVQDTTVPAVFDLSFNTSVEFDGNVIFYVNVTDLSTITSVLLEYNGTNYSMNDEGNNRYNYTLASPNVGNNQAFTIYAIDSQGNINSSVNNTFNVTDLTVPDVFGLNTNSPVEFDGNVNITINVTDLNLDSVFVEINGNNETMSVLSGDIYNLTLSGLAIGSYPFTIYANDSQNNVNDSITGTIVVQDTIVPQVTNLIANNVEFNQNNTINVTVTDLSGISEVILELDGTTNYTMTNNSADNFNVTLVSPSVGVHNIVIYSNDTQGNRNDSVTGSFTVTETTAPSVTGVVTNSPVEFDGNVTFNATITDLSEIDSALVELNGVNYSMSNTSLTDFNLTISGLSVGSYSYTIYVNDSFGNINNSETGTVIVQDTTIPQVFGLQTSDVEFDGNLTVRVNATDLSGIDEVILELDSTTNYTMVLETGDMYNYTLTSPSVGTRNIRIYVNDTQGNRNDSITGSFNVNDTTAPVWSPVPSNQTIELGLAFEYDVDATDLQSITYSLNDTTNFAINSSGSVTNITSLNLGIYQLELNASDGNNDNITNINVSVVDTTAPKWSLLPSNQVAELGSAFEYGVNATDLQSITYSLNDTTNFAINSSGSIINATSLLVGIYQLELNATDASGNVNTTNINITVGDNVAPQWSPLPSNQNVELGDNFEYDVNATDLTTITYSINDTTNFAINSSGSITNATSLSLGTYELELNATDTSGNVNSTNINITVGDATVPAVFDLTFTNSIEFNNNLTIFVNVTDLNAITSVLLEYNGTNYSMNDEGNDRYNYTLISPSVGNDQLFTIYATDNSGNTNSSVTGAFNVTDSIAPVWDPTPSNQAIELGTAFSYDVNATDLSSISYSVNNSNFNIDSNGLITNATTLSVGLYQLELNASDSVNDNLTNINVSVVDTTVPQVSNSQVDLTVFSNQTFNITVDVQDLSPIDDVIVGINNGSVETNYSMSLDSGNTYNLTLTNFTAGSYTLTYYVNDSFNNLNDSVTDSFTVVASNSAPSITTFTPASSTFEEGDLLNITIVATDTESIPTINLSINGTQIATSTSGTLNYEYNFTNTDEGSYNYTACATDGIESTCVTRIYNVTDKAIPDLTNVSPTGTVFGSSQTIIIYPDRDIDSSNFTLVVNSVDVTGSSSATSTNITFNATNLPSGTNTVNVTATDLQGNTESYNWTFTVDITSTVSGYVLDSSEDGIGSANVEVSYANNGTVIGDTNVLVSGSWVEDFTLEEGNYTFTVTAADYITNTTNISVDGSDQEINFTLTQRPNIRVSTLSHIPSFEVEYQDITFTAGLLYDGEFDDTVNVSLYRNGSYVTSKNISLDKDNVSYSVDLEWTNATVGTYDFEVNVTGLSEESFISDNSASQVDIDIVPVEDVLSLGIRGVPSFSLPANNYTLNVYTDVSSSSAVDLYNIPVTFVNASGITLNNGTDLVTFNISAGSTVTSTWEINFIINSTGSIPVSNVSANIYNDITLSKNITASAGGLN